MNRHPIAPQDIEASIVPLAAGGKQTAEPQKHGGHTRLFIYEAVFVASFNMLNSSAVAWIFFHRRPEIPVWGLSGVVFNALPSSFVPAFLITIAGTLALRQKRAKTKHQVAVPASEWRIVARLPEAIWQRALVIALGAAAITGLLTSLWGASTGVGTLDFKWFMETQLVQACLLGLVVGPIVGARALLEPAR